MKLLSGKKVKKVNYFGIEFELPECFKGHIKTHQDGWVFAVEEDCLGDFVSSTFLGTVDLEGMSWEDTRMEVLSK
jgi:hypothetical protein